MKSEMAAHNLCDFYLLYNCKLETKATYRICRVVIKVEVNGRSDIKSESAHKGLPVSINDEELRICMHSFQIVSDV